MVNYILNSTDVSCLDFICVRDTLLDEALVEVIEENNKEIFSYGIINNSKIGLYENVYYIVDN